MNAHLEKLHPARDRIESDRRWLGELLEAGIAASALRADWV